MFRIYYAARVAAAVGVETLAPKDGIFSVPLSPISKSLGLLSEEYDPAAKRLLGNFPQAFSDIALVNTAHNIARPEKPCEQRSGHLSLPASAE